MAPASPGPEARGPRSTIAARLSRARSRSFVGRSAEQELWSAALAADAPPFAVLWISGPGGVGKTTLLDRLAALAEAAGVTPLQLDARRLMASPDQCLDALRTALGLPAASDPVARLHGGGRHALFIDTAEMLGSLERWLREDFVPRLPSDCLVVVAGRSGPEPAWGTDAGWADLLRVVALRNLSPLESRTLLSARGVPEHDHERLLSVTHGHPLALSLVAEVASQGRGGEAMSPVHAPDVLRCLLERFSHDAPDEAHRTALYAAAHSRVTDEASLRAAVGTEDARELYDWLRSLSFVEEGPEGLHLHDLASEALDCDLRRRDPARHATLHGRVRGSMVERLRAAHGLAKVRVATDMMWMHRFSPVMGPIVDWLEARSLYRAPVTDADRPDIVEATRRFEGDAAARAIEHWLDLHPHEFVVIRSGKGGVGYVVSLLFEASDQAAAAADPRVAAAFAHAAATGPLREGDRIVLHLWLSYEAHLAPGAIVSQCSVECLICWPCTPRLAFSFVGACARLDEWLPFFAYIDHPVGPAADVGGTRYQLAVHDWRKTPPDTFWDLMGERELHGGVSLAEPTDAEPLLVLSQEEFADTVKRALRDFARKDALAQNPLSRCRVVIECPHAKEGKDPLRTALETAAESLVASPKDERFYSVVKTTFLSPAPTQEAAAERLGLPFSTYRRHLGTALERVVEFLWQRELHGWG